jgi:prephenate dehydratase/chorismate mutase/prephenate dehydratase
MNKRLASLLIAILCLILAGCSGQQSQQAQQDEQPAEPQISYEDAKVSYLGPQGTYTEEACQHFFEGKGEYLPYATVDEAVKALVDGQSNFAVIPQENTIGGAVIDYVDTLIVETKVTVVGEVELTINQNLLVLPDTQLSDIRTVYSHKQGIAQGKAWLEKNLPDAEVVEVSSTAAGARMVAEGQDKSCAAIASAGCSEVYGLDILAENIQENESNKTRFYVLTCAEPGTAQSDRLAFIATGSAEALPALMEELDDREVTLVTIHDRQLKTELGEYHYLIECENCSYDTFEALKDKTELELRYLGSFAVK